MRKIITVLLIGCMACIAFAGVCRYVTISGENKKVIGNEQQDEQALISTTEVPQIQVTMAPEKDREEAAVPITMAPVEETEVPLKKEKQVEEITTEAPQVQTTMTPETSSEGLQEIEKEILKLSTEAPPTTAPTEVPTIAPTEVPAPIVQTQVPQITEIPTTTPAPIVEEVHIHDFEKAVWELPTCEKGGYYNNICKICGLEESVSQEPLPHEKEDILIQEGNCMEDRVIRHVCKNCGTQVESDTRYPLYDVHQWGVEEVDGVMLEYCERCGVVK
ncbi:MAG: hypothetical protein IKK33_04395 [Lachnospiraceae bacterium]|nr:hypothetical protein [Lachnospiraceae bacterium]